ncbi:MAG: DUF1552 domain-containing protein, partial [Myxococcota bacterium]
MMSPTRKFSRRTLLAGAAAGGALAGVPWLESLAGRAKAQGSTPPLRFVVVSVGHSVMPSGNVRAWLPGSAGALSSLPSILSPLEAFRDRMSIVGGIDNLVSRLVSSNGHNASSRTLLTCMPHADALDGGGNLLPDAPSLGQGSDAAGPSLDYVLSDALGGFPLVLRTGTRNGEHRRNFRLDASYDDGEPDPSVAFGRLFGDSTPQPMLSPRDRLALRRAEIMGTVQENYRALAGRVGVEDRRRLEQHADHINAVQEELSRMVETVCEDPTLTLPSGFPSNFEDGNGRNDDLIAESHNSVVATALGCQAVRVASMHYSTMQNNKFPFLNGGTDLFAPDFGWHGVIHHDRGTDMDRFVTCQWYYDVLADLLRKLDAIPEGDGTVLDNTIVFWTSSLGASSHSTANLPVLLFGGANTPFVKGQMIDYQGNERTLGDLYTTFFHMMGAPRNSFGWN